MPDRRYSRRTVLRRSVATAGAAGLVSTAGCSAIPNPFGGSSYTSWLVAPDDFADVDHYQFLYFNMEQIESNEDQLDGDNFNPNFFEQFWPALDFDWEDVSTLITFGGLFGFGSGSVVEADFNRGDAISTLEGEDFEEDSEYNGFTLMLNQDEQSVYAVGGGAVVIAPTGEDGNTDRVEALIDAKNGDADRYGDASDDMSTLTGELGGGTFLNGRTMDPPEQPSAEAGLFENMVARGSRTKVNGDTADVKYVVVYESSDDVDTADLEEWVDANNDASQFENIDSQFENLDNVEYSSDGRKGIITATVDAGNI